MAKDLQNRIAEAADSYAEQVYMTINGNDHSDFTVRMAVEDAYKKAAEKWFWEGVKACASPEFRGKE